VVIRVRFGRDEAASGAALLVIGIRPALEASLGDVQPEFNQDV